MKKHILEHILLAVASLLLSGCGEPQPVPEVDFLAPLPSAAAHYRSFGATSRAVIHEWRFWREPALLITENLGDGSVERWQSDGNTVFHQKLFHDLRAGVEFQFDDLRMLDAIPSWTQRAMLVDPEVIKKLKRRKAGWRDGYPFHRYLGEIDGVDWDVTLRTDLMLPTVVIRRRDGANERIELVEAYARDAAPWAPTTSDGYELIDFADLGDRAHDPVVMQLEHRLGVAAHAH